LGRVIELEHNLQEEKLKNENLNHLLGQVGEMSIRLEQKKEEVALLQVQMDKLTIDSNNLWEVVVVQIKEGLRVNYKITT